MEQKKPPTATLVAMHASVACIWPCPLPNAEVKPACQMTLQNHNTVPQWHGPARKWPTCHSVVWPHLRVMALAESDCWWGPGGLCSAAAAGGQRRGEWPDLEITAGFYSWKLHPTYQARTCLESSGDITFFLNDILKVQGDCYCSCCCCCSDWLTHWGSHISDWSLKFKHTLKSVAELWYVNKHGAVRGLKNLITGSVSFTEGEMGSFLSSPCRQERLQVQI